MDAALYGSLGDGFGIAPEADLQDLRKALDAGYATDPASQTGGGALRVESLEGSLKVTTFRAKHIVMWRDIPKTKAFSTVEEWNRLSSYGSGGAGFLKAGELPEEADSTYTRQTSLVKFIGNTRVVTHPMSLVRTMIGDVIGREQINGILWCLREVERGLFFGDSKLGRLDGAGNASEYVEFDGLRKLIPAANVIDLKGQPLDERTIRNAGQLILDNHGVATHLYASPRVLEDFAKEYIPAARVPLPTADGTLAGGYVVDRVRTAAGTIDLRGDIFLRKNTVPQPPTADDNSKVPSPSPTAALANAAADNITDWTKGPTAITTVRYAISPVNAKGQGARILIPAAGAGAFAVAAGQPVTVTITSPGGGFTAGREADYYRIWRRDNDTGDYGEIGKVAANAAAGQAVTFTDRNAVLANTYEAFMGELTDDVLQARQLLDMVRMDLAVISPAYRFMVLIYLVLSLYQDLKWVRLSNVGESS